MKIFTFFFSTVLFCCLSTAVFAQVTNLTVNDSTQNFVMTSGGVISWSYNVPQGDTALAEIWYDINHNGKIDSATDVLYQAFNQIDGDTSGFNGPPDMDGQVNGTISMQMPVGVAPGNYIFKFTDKNQGETVAGTVEPMTNPAIKISGRVIVPSGMNAADIFVEISRGEQYFPNFWDAVTDSNGNYTIDMNSDTAGNPWTLDLINNSFHSAVISPDSYSIVVKGDTSNLNFSIKMPAAEIKGRLMTDKGQLVPNWYVALESLGNNYYTGSNTDVNGNYDIGLPDSVLSGNNAWQLNAHIGNSDTTGSTLDAVYFISSIKTSDVIQRDLILYTADSFIKGTVKVDGQNPGFVFKIYAFAQDTAQAVEWTDSTNGNFVLPVSSKIYSYSIDVDLSGRNYYVNNIDAHPGDDSVIVNLSTSPTEAKQSTGNLPDSYELDQNYPNPFNPSTNIRYSIPKSGFVKLVVYNILGEAVKILVNSEQSAGTYNINFNADNLSSGIYFYKINAANYSSVKKMILLK